MPLQKRRLKLKSSHVHPANLLGAKRTDKGDAMTFSSIVLGNMTAIPSRALYFARLDSFTDPDEGYCWVLVPQPTGRSKVLCLTKSNAAKLQEPL